MPSGREQRCAALLRSHASENHTKPRAKYFPTPPTASSRLFMPSISISEMQAGRWDILPSQSLHGYHPWVPLMVSRLPVDGADISQLLLHPTLIYIDLLTDSPSGGDSVLLHQRPSPRYHDLPADLRSEKFQMSR